MKNIFKLSLLAASALFVASCNDAEYGAIQVGEGNLPRAFFVEGISSSVPGIQALTLDLDEGVKRNLTLQVALSEVSDQDATFRVVIDEAVLDKYNVNNNTSLIMNPEEYVSLGESVTVKAGENVSEPIVITLSGVAGDLAANPYAAPVKLEKVSGNVEVTSTSGAYIYALTPKVINTLACFNGATGLGVADLNAQYESWTLEIRFQVSNTDNRNRDVFNGGSVLMRFEDPNPGGSAPAFPYHSLVQFQGSGGYLNPSKNFEPNVWQHLACTWDGKTITLYVNGENAGSKDFDSSVVGDGNFPTISWMGGSAGGGHGTGSTWWRNCKILATEARMWSVCRTADQVANNIKTIDPNSAGLEGYWRFNKASHTQDGSTHIFEDLTGNGHPCVTGTQFTWVENIKGDDTATPWP